LQINHSFSRRQHTFLDQQYLKHFAAIGVLRQLFLFVGEELLISPTGVTAWVCRNRIEN